MKNKTFFFLVVLFVIVDQFSKFLFQKILTIGNPMNIFSFFSFTLTKNTGTLFGLFKNANNILLFLTLIVIGAILYYYDKIEENQKFPFVLILAGGIGNLIDRIFSGGVIDFIDFKIWPVFNIADSMITIGIIWLIILIIKEEIF